MQSLKEDRYDALTRLIKARDEQLGKIDERLDAHTRLAEASQKSSVDGDWGNWDDAMRETEKAKSICRNELSVESKGAARTLFRHNLKIPTVALTIVGALVYFTLNAPALPVIAAVSALSLLASAIMTKIETSSYSSSFIYEVRRQIDKRQSILELEKQNFVRMLNNVDSHDA